MMRTCLVFLCLILAACGGGQSSIKDTGLVAEKLGRVPGPGGCGITDAYLLRSAAGVRLSQPAKINGATARALDRWLRNDAIPAFGNRGGGLEAIQVAAHYACRNVNNRRSGRLSEHAKGNAIDISAFILADGIRITVLNGWNGRDGSVLRKLHRSACGPFKTVLGPNADRFHKDHFHFDLRPGGKYCL